MSSETHYADSLITVTDKEIVFHHYYFPTGKAKVVPLHHIESIRVLKPTLANGKWRLHGSGSFKIWFPLDGGRPKRDRIFLATLKTQWVDIGFTAEDGARIEALFRAKNLLKP